MVKKVKKPVIKPLIVNEVINLPCNSYIKIRHINNEFGRISIETDAPMTSSDFHYIPIGRESIKPLIKLLQRAEKTFQKR